jgi:PKD repeat protein
VPELSTYYSLITPRGPFGDGNGAGLWLYAGEGTNLLNVTIAGSRLNPKQGIYIFGGATNITNTIISNHAIGLERENNDYYGGVVFEDHNLFYSNTINLTGTVSGGTHDVFGNPNFIDPANNDYHIAPPSAAIDAGTDAGVYTDLDGSVRPSGSGFDIGAYEVAIATVPITGLKATNGSPTAFGYPTTLTATIEAGDVVTYRWDFGDSSSVSNGNPLTHIYPAPGMYTTIVTASNSLSTVTATTTVTVYVTPVAGLTVSNTSPTVLGQPTGLLAAISAGDFVSYTWNLGDGVSATGVITTHTYPAVGVYTASVTAFNSVNALTATTRVTIKDVPLSGLNASNNSPSAIGSATTLAAAISAGSNVTYTWNFGDGSSVVFGQVVTYTYPFSAAFRFTATVTATNSVNSQTAMTTVIIVPKRVYLPLLIK